MRLDLTTKQHHTDIVSAVAWSPDGMLLTVSDDKTVCRWSADGDMQGSFPINVFGTNVSWFPKSGKQSPDAFAMSCTDGTIRFITKTGREEKKINAHSGAVISIKWSHDGSAILTAGEDGDVKIWSKSGNLRSCLMSTGQSVYCTCWGPDDDQVIIGNGKMLMIKTVQANRKNLQWNAHDGIVLCVDWNVANGLIISGGEDCTYKVWDAFGRQLKSSQPVEHVITSIGWSPNGESFAVGSYNVIRLCDKTGWSHCRHRLQIGSVMNLAWTSDGTQFACAGGNGSTVFAQIVDRRFEWKNTEVTLLESRKIRVQDVAMETMEDLEFSRDRVVELGLGFEHLVVSSTTQCFIYSLQNLNTPIIFDVRAPPHFIHLCRRHFLTLDQISGMQVISYEGRVLSTPKFQGLRPEYLTRDMVSLSPDTLVVVDSVDAKNIQIIDASSGRIIGRLNHGASEVVSVYLNQHNLGPQERLLAYSDRNRDLFIASLHSGSSAQGGVLNAPTYKLHTHVESFIFNDETNVLVCLADGFLKFWYYPDIALVDKDLLQRTTTAIEATEFGHSAQILAYTANRVSIRKVDGSILFTATTQDIPLLYEFTRAGRWDEATRLCRHQKSPNLWATLGSMALAKKQLDTAEIALAELDEVAKVEYIQYIKSIPSDEGKQAEMALLRHHPDEAERILLQASPPLLYRAIKLNIDLYRWNRALDLAVKQKVHVDTVLAYRQRHLDAFERTESLPKFQQLSKQVSFDWDTVLSNEKRDLDEEFQRIKGGRK